MKKKQSSYGPPLWFKIGVALLLIITFGAIGNLLYHTTGSGFSYRLMEEKQTTSRNRYYKIERKYGNGKWEQWAITSDGDVARKEVKTLNQNAKWSKEAEEATERSQRYFKSIKWGKAKKHCSHVENTHDGFIASSSINDLIPAPTPSSTPVPMTTFKFVPPVTIESADVPITTYNLFITDSEGHVLGQSLPVDSGGIPVERTVSKEPFSIHGP